MMYVITNLARIFCGALHHSIVALECLLVTLQGAHRRRNRQTTECNETCRVKSKKQARTSRSNPIQSPRLRRKGNLPFHPELLWLASHLQISSCVNPSVECWPIFHMLSHLEPNFRHSFVHLVRRCHLGSHCARRTMPRVFPPWGSLLRSGPSFPMAGVCLHEFPQSSVPESAHRYRERRQLDVPVRSLACAGLQHKDVKTKHIREVYASAVMLNHLLACIQRQVWLFQSRWADTRLAFT